MKITKCMAYILVLAMMPRSSFAAEIKPSFNCEKAKTRIEKTICSDQDIALLDMYMADLYKTIVDSGENPEVVNEQKNWIANIRNKSCIASAAQDEDISGLLSTCYYDRVKELTEYFVAPDVRFQKKYYDIILSKGEVADPEGISDPAEKYVARTKLENAFDNLVVDTNNISPNIIHWDGKFLILHYYGSSYGGGASIVYNGKEKLCYSEATREFTPSTYWSCHGSALSDEVISSAFKVFQEIVETSQPSISKKDILKRFMVYPTLAMNDDVLYTKAAVEFTKNNTAVIAALLGKHRENAAAILNDMNYIHQNIVSTHGWNEKLKAGAYSDGWNCSYHFISNNFPPLPEAYNETIDEGIAYTYGEFYYRIWKKLYANDAMDDAHEAIEFLLKALQP